MISLIEITLTNNSIKKMNAEIGKVIESKQYILGKQLDIFERKFAKFIGSKYAIGVASGTDALRLSLRALGIGKGDNVLTVAFTSPFTVIAILEEGAVPIFCDIDQKTLTIDLEDAEKKIDKKTKAIIPVHIYGNPCNIKNIIKLAKKHKLKVIEDACQAHGAKYGGKRVGAFGDTAAFSFYPTKNLGAIGDAGAITTDNSSLAKKIKLLRHGGQTKRFWHEYRGINSRLDEIQAAVLNIKLKMLDADNRRRQYLAARYRKKLKGLPLTFQESFNSAISVYHLFIIRTKQKSLLQKFLKKHGVATDTYYPYPVHLQKAFRKYYTGKLPITEKIVDELLAIPISPSLSFKKQDLITSSIIKFYKNK